MSLQESVRFLTARLLLICKREEDCRLVDSAKPKKPKTRKDLNLFVAWHFHAPILSVERLVRQVSARSGQATPLHCTCSMRRQSADNAYLQTASCFREAECPPRTHSSINKLGAQLRFLVSAYHTLGWDFDTCNLQVLLVPRSIDPFIRCCLYSDLRPSRLSPALRQYCQYADSS